MNSILIVDQQTVFRAAFAAFLVERFPDFSVAAVGSESEALEYLNFDTPSFLFANVRLPNGNGVQLIKKIKNEHPEVMAAVMSLYDFPEYLSAAFENNVDYFICHAAVDTRGIIGFIESGLADSTASGSAA